MKAKARFNLALLGVLAALFLVGCSNSQPAPAPTTSDDQYWKKGGGDQPQGAGPTTGGTKAPR